MAIPHITQEQVAQYGVVTSPDRLTGKPADNKAIFDRLVRELVCKVVNDIIDQTNLLLVAEDERIQQENGRVNAETLRVNAETLRVSAETTRSAAEKARSTAEIARENAEKNRGSEEAARKTAQEAWVLAEGTRVAAEVLRVEAEKTRASAETARVAAEAGRATDETGRGTAEAGRVTAEAGRVTAETGRVTAETARDTAEKARANETAGIVAQASDKALLAESYAHGGTGILRNPLTLLDAKNIIWDAQKRATFPGTGTMPAEGKTYRITVDGVAYDAAAVPLIPAVRSVGVSPSAATIAPGGTRQFTAVVAAENDAPTAVTWSLTGATQQDTTLSAAGLLTVGATEKGPLTVTATSTFDATKTGTAAITVEGKLAITGVTVDPSYFYYISGTSTKQFAASVLPAGAPQGVTWSLTGATQAGTTLSSSGLLTIAFGERANLVVRATSTDDTTKYGTATVQHDENPPVDPDPPLEPPVRSMRAAPRAAATGYTITAGAVTLTYKIAGNAWTLTTTDTAVKSVSVRLEQGPPEGADNAKYYAQEAKSAQTAATKSAEVAAAKVAEIAGIVLQSVPLTGGAMSGTLTAPRIWVDGLDIAACLRQFARIHGIVPMPVTDLASLLAATRKVESGENAFALDAVTLAQLKDKTFGASFKAGLIGDDLQTTEFTDTISFVAMMVELAKQAGPGGTISWNQIQYALLHVPAALPAEGAANAEALDQYWWKDGGGRVTDLAGLLKAAEVAAADNFTAPLKTLTLGTINGPVPGTPGDTANFYFRNTGAGGLYGTVADFASKMTDLATDVSIASPAPDGNKDVKNLSWAQVQYYLINSRYVDKATADPLIADTPQTYWWYQGGSKPVEVPTIEKLLTNALLRGLNDPSMPITVFDEFNTPENLTALGFKANNGGAAITEGNIGPIKTALRLMYTKYKTKPGVWNAGAKTFTLTWDQVQYYIITKNPANTVAQASSMWNSTYKNWHNDVTHDDLIKVNKDGAVTLSLSAEVLELTPEAPIPPVEPDIPSVEVPPAPPAEEVAPGLPPETAGDPPAAMEEVKGEAAPALTATAPAAPPAVPAEK